MGQMLVRNLDDGVIERLKERAAERGTSLEQVARDALAAAAKLTFAEFKVRADAIAARQPPQTSDSTDYIRSMRDGLPDDVP